MIARQTVFSAALLAAGALVLAGCSTAGPAGPTGSPTASGAASGTASGTVAAGVSSCVVDPEGAIAAGKTAQPTGELPAELVGALDAAAQEAFDLGASPGAIVGVQTPEGKWT